MNKNITIIKKLKDDKYQNDHSQVDEETRNIHKCPKWYWGLGSDEELYFKGQISGYSYIVQVGQKNRRLRCHFRPRKFVG